MPNLTARWCSNLAEADSNADWSTGPRPISGQAGRARAQRSIASVQGHTAVACRIHERQQLTAFTNTLTFSSPAKQQAIMSGRGKGGKGLGKGGAKRHRKVLRDNIQGEQSLPCTSKGLVVASSVKVARNGP